MTVHNYIVDSLINLPSLYKDVDWEKSKMKILNHVFLVIGNGVEIAISKNGSQGYFTKPNFYKKGETHIRKLDKNYNNKSNLKLPKNFFDRKVYYVSCTYEKLGSRDKYWIQSEDNHNEDFHQKYLLPKPVEANSTYDFQPYPISEYSAVIKCVKNNVFLQDDWKQAGIDLCHHVIDYYESGKWRNNTYLSKLSEQQIEQQIYHCNNFIKYYK